MKERKIQFDSKFILDLDAENEKRTYGFSFESFENEISKHQLFYEIQVHMQDSTGSGSYIIEMNRKNIYVNNEPPKSHIEKIANIAAQTIFPVRIKIKKDGQIDQIVNHDLIEKRWLAARKNIVSYYKGEKIQKVIAQIDAILLNGNHLKLSIEQNWFFHLFFKPLYINYGEKLQTKHIWQCPVFGNQFIEYGVVQSIKENYSDDDKVLINADGTAIDERTLEEIKSGFKFSKEKLSGTLPVTSFIESTMNVDYKLYEEDRSISSVIGTFNTKINENIQQKIQLEIYHLTDSSSYRPVSDVKKKEFFEMFQSWQTAGDENIIDVSKPKWQVPTPLQPKMQELSQEKIELFVGVGPDVKPYQSFGDWIKSIFKKNK